jgi:Ala-tRNA(Pro) deacylase
MRVVQFLSEQHVAFETMLYPPAFSAQKRAKHLRMPGRHVTKSVLLAGPEDYFLAVLPATDRVDTTALAAALGGPVRVADAREVADVFPDCEWGVVVPFGSLYGLPTVLEAQIDPDAVLVFEGPTHAEAFRMRCREFERLEHPARLPFATVNCRRTVSAGAS